MVESCVSGILQPFVSHVKSSASAYHLCRVSFDDLHNTGIYTWDYLHELGGSKFTRAKQYIRALRQQGLSRDPRTRKPAVK